MWITPRARVGETRKVLDLIYRAVRRDRSVRESEQETINPIRDRDSFLYVCALMTVEKSGAKEICGTSVEPCSI